MGIPGPAPYPADMSALTIRDHPSLHDPVLVVAFAGWNDAADAASGAVHFLQRQAPTRPFAEIDPDDFFVFTETRPTVKLIHGQTRAIQWPATEFRVCTIEQAPQDLILGLGREPNLKWKTFAGHIVEVAEAVGAEEIVTLGALLADTPHTRPVPLTGSSSDPERSQRFGFQASRYEGPTGIVGAIGDACRRAGAMHTSLWASVPHYVSGGHNPKATRALLEKLSTMYDLGLETAALDARVLRYEAQINEALKANHDVLEYVRRLEEAIDSGGERPVLHAGDRSASIRWHEDVPPDNAPPLESQDVLEEVDRLLRGDDQPDP